LPTPSDERIGRSRAVDLLASTLGEEKALAAWDDAGRRLGFPPSDSLRREQVIAIFDAISLAPGLVGVAGRYARLRLDHVNMVAPGGARGAVDTESGAGPEISTELLGLLAPSVGEEKAKEGLAQAARGLSLSPTELTREGALRVLDVMAKLPGLPGVAARFGKARFLLRHPR
jgi:hypothetical protein